MSKLLKLDSYHLLNNFPRNSSFFKRALSQLVFLLLATKVTRRKNRLTDADYRLASEVIVKGDIVLVGGFRSVSGLFLGKFFTHILLYQGDGVCIHAGADGVDTVGLDELFGQYDNLVVLRPEIENISDKERIINETLSFVQKQLGKPYDFYLENKVDRYYCTYLINTAFLRAGYDTGLKAVKWGRKAFLFIRIHRALRADDFLLGNFRLIFSSDSLKGKKTELKNKF